MGTCTVTVRTARSGTVRSAPRALAAALTVCAAVALGAPAAAGSPAAESPGTGSPRASADGAGVRVVPRNVRPGAEVELLAAACEGTVGTARSAAFVTDALLAPAPGGGLRGEAAVRSDTEPGKHRITVECEGAGKGAGAAPTGLVTVDPSGGGGDGDGTAGEPSARPSAAPPADPSADLPEGPENTAEGPAGDTAGSPVAPVPAGGGGTAGDSGPGALHTALGAALAGAVGLVVAWRAVLSRRRARSRGTDG